MDDFSWLSGPVIQKVQGIGISSICKFKNRQTEHNLILYAKIQYKI